MDLKEMKNWCQEIKRLKQLKSEKQKEVEAIDEELSAHEALVSAFLEGNQLDRFDFGEGLVYRQEQVSVKIIDKEAFKLAIGSDQYDALSSVNSNTLKSIIKQKRQEAFDNGELDYNMAGVEIKTYYNLNLRKN